MSIRHRCAFGRSKRWPSLRGIVAFGLVASSLAAGPAPPAARSAITVTVRALHRSVVPQGERLLVGARALNPNPQPVTVTISFRLRPQTPRGNAVAVLNWTARIPAGGFESTSFPVTTSQWFGALGTFAVAPWIAGRRAGDPLRFRVLAARVQVPVFEDVTAAAGLDTVLGGHPCSRHGNGAAWGDADGDGFLDLYVPNASADAQLWMNDGSGHFVDEGAARGVDESGAIGMGAAFVDVDGDGDQDLYVVNDGPNRLYRNDGTGHFADVAAAAGVDDPGPGPSASFADYDADGRLDLYVTNYLECNRAQPDRLYHQEADGTFSDQTALLEREATTAGAGFQAAWVDVDADGDQDLYLANDYLPEISQQPNVLWRNDGPGPRGGWRFTDASAVSGLGYAENSMGIGVGDVDGDLDLDLAISNIAGNVLARNNGDGTFTDVAAEAGMQRPEQRAGLASVTWGLGFFDFNLDGWEDLYAAAGPFGGRATQPNELFVNAGGGRFLDLSAAGGAADPGVSRGVAFADYDRDGRVDLYVVNEFGEPHLFRNVTPFEGHWLEVRTVGTASNRDGCGARVVLASGERRMVRELFCGSISLAAGSDSTLHFGLRSGKPVRLDIEWPSGLRQVVTGVAVDRLITVVEAG